MAGKGHLKYRGAVAVYLLLGVLGTASAQIQLPAPEDRSVHDFAGVLSADAVQTMERFHKELFDSTQVAIVVVTVPSLDGEPVADFAVRVGEEWGVGGGQDCGIVVAMAIEDRVMFIATGYGVEGFLPDGRVSEVFGMTPGRTFRSKTSPLVCFRLVRRLSRPGPRNTA